MVRMGVGDDDHVDLIGANAGKRSAFTEVRLREALQAAAVEEMTGGEPYTHISR